MATERAVAPLLGVGRQRAREGEAGAGAAGEGGAVLIEQGDGAVGRGDGLDLPAEGEQGLALTGECLDEAWVFGAEGALEDPLGFLESRQRGAGALALEQQAADRDQRAGDRGVARVQDLALDSQCTLVEGQGLLFVAQAGDGEGEVVGGGRGVGMPPRPRVARAARAPRDCTVRPARSFRA